MTDNRFESNGGTQNIGQGTGAIGQQNNYGISPAIFAEYAGKLAVTDAALASFFKILEEQQVPHSDLDSKLQEIAGQYKELLLRLETVQSEDPQVVRLKQEARQAIEAGDYAEAEELLNQAEARDVQAIEQLEDAARQRRISAAASNVDNAKLQEVRLRYAKAAEYWQKAAALLPEVDKEGRAYYLNKTGEDLYRISCGPEALPFYEKSLALCQEIRQRHGQGVFLNNIGKIYYAQSEQAKALACQEQSLSILQEIGDRKGEGTALNDIGAIYEAQGRYDQALEYMEQSLDIHREVGDRKGEGATLNNIGQIYNARGDYDKALDYLERSLAIRKEMGDRHGEAGTSWNIGHAYKDQSDLSKAEQYVSRAVQLAEEIGYPKLEEWRKGLEKVRAELKAL